MTEQSYIDLFYPERFISLEGNIVRDLEPFSVLLAHAQRDLVRWMIFWDEGSVLQIFGVTKDGLAILQDRICLEKRTKSAAVDAAKACLSGESTDPEWSHCPFLVYCDRRHSYKHDCDYQFAVFWDGHTRFILGIGDDWCDEDSAPYSHLDWFNPNVGGCVRLDYDDTLGYLDPGTVLDVTHTRSDYADNPEALITSAASMVDYDARDLDTASVSDAMDDLSNAGFSGFLLLMGGALLAIAMVAFKVAAFSLAGMTLLYTFAFWQGDVPNITLEKIEEWWLLGAVIAWGMKWIAGALWSRFGKSHHG